METATPALALRDATIARTVRNTYALLTVTLLWSAGFAYASIQLGIGPAGGLALALFALIPLIATQACRNSGFGLLWLMVFTAMEGLSLGPMLARYLHLPNGSGIVFAALAGTALVFGALSAYVHISRRNFSFLGGFLFVGLILLLVVGVALMFFPVPGAMVAWSAVSVLLFSGFILHDTSQMVHGDETNYIVLTVGLYLDALNIFTSLLNIFGIGPSE